MRALGPLRPTLLLSVLLGGVSTCLLGSWLLDYDVVLYVELVVHVHNVDLYRAIAVHVAAVTGRALGRAQVLVLVGAPLSRLWLVERLLGVAGALFDPSL